MVVVIWLNAGYAMVLLSAAIKAVPEETMEAARIDGANERQAFFRVIMPQVRTTIVAVFITVLIGVMKIFDIVFAMTKGRFNTTVLGVEFYNQLFAFQNPGKAAAVVVFLIIAVSRCRLSIKNVPGPGGPPMTGSPDHRQDQGRDAIDAPDVTRAKGTRKNPLLTVLLAVLAVLWMVPVLGLLITSFRDTRGADQRLVDGVHQPGWRGDGRLRTTAQRFPDPPVGPDRALRRSS